MTAVAIILCVLCQLLIVAGQLLLKHAVSAKDADARRRGRARNFALGIACMSVWFFLWVGLMSRWELSKLFPFEGLNPAIMAVAAWLLLKERMPAGAWLGLALVCAGIVIVASS
jgi:drug/metabolite transporter (DMT)-like permease